MSIREDIFLELGNKSIEDFQRYQNQLSSWKVLSDPLDKRFYRMLEKSRVRKVELLRSFIEEEMSEKKVNRSIDLVDTYFLKYIQVRMWLSYPYLNRSKKESKLLKASFENFPNIDGLDLFKEILTLSFYISPDQMPFLTAEQIESLSKFEFKYYLDFLSFRPFLASKDEELRYEQFLPQLFSWLLEMKNSFLVSYADRLVAQLCKDLNLGIYYLIESNPLNILEARRDLMSDIQQSDPVLRKISGFDLKHHKANRDGREKIRVGFLARTLRKGPDSESLFALFREFDLSKYEIYAYSIDHRDRVVREDKGFDKMLNSLFSSRQIVRYRDGIDSIVDGLREDNLDIFILANSTHFGIGDADFLASYRVAPVQIISNSVVPVPSGLDSFDYFLTSRSDNPDNEVSLEGIHEAPLYIEPTTICYPFRFDLDSEEVLDRSLLGFSDDDVIFYNGGSLDKLREPCLRTFFEVIKRVPNSKLLLAPYNSGWSGKLHAASFQLQVEKIACEMGLDMNRIFITNELTITEAHNMMDLCDIYLASYPHGGATTVTIALSKEKPVIVKRRESTRSIDQFLVNSVGLPELLCDSESEFVDVAVSVAKNPRMRKSISKFLEIQDGSMAFFDVAGYSKRFQLLIDGLVKEHAKDIGVKAGKK